MENRLALVVNAKSIMDLNVNQTKKLLGVSIRIDNHPASIEDLIGTYDQDIMCVGSKSMVPFFENIVCYSVIDKRTKDYSEKILEDYKKTYDILSDKIKNKEITIPEANSIKDNKYSETIKNLLPLFHKFKL